MTPAQKSGAASIAESLRNFRGVACRSFDVFRESSIHGYASNLLLDAEIFVAVAAELAFAAAPMQPGYADSIADFEIFHGGAFFDDAAGDFVAEYQRFFGDASD